MKGAYVLRDPLGKVSAAYTEPHEGLEYIEGFDWQSTLTYRDLRASEYPPIGDQLDALMKWVAGATMQDSEAFPQELQSIAARCSAVKARYPKPDSQEDA